MMIVKSEAQSGMNWEVVLKNESRLSVVDFSNHCLTWKGWMRMNKEETILWLKRYREAEREINRLIDEMHQARSRSERVTQVLSFAPVGKTGGSQIERVVEKMAEIQGQIVEAVYRQDEIKKEILQAIDEIQNQNQQEVLKYIYINGYTVDKTAEVKCYERRQIYRIHNQGVEKVSHNVTARCARMIL